MSNFAEGDGPDVNTDAGFNAFIAGKAGVDITPEKQQELQDSDRSIQSGLTVEESTPETHRDEQGRFTPATPPAAAPEEGVAPPEVDPSVAEFLARHGGDSDAAIAAAVKQYEEAQSLIGRQGNELGTVRQEIAELRGRVQAVQESRAQVAPLPVVNDEQQAQLEEFFANEGGDRAMSWIAENRPDLIDSGIAAWAELDPRAAYRFESRMDALSLAQQQQPAPQAQDPILLEMHATRRIASAVDVVKQEFPEEDWKFISPHLAEVFDDPQTPEMIRREAVSQDSSSAVEAIRWAAQLAKGRALSAAATQAATQRATEQAAARKGATVISSAQRPVTPAAAGPDGELTSAERQRLFKEALMNTPTTSVQEGLTYAK